MKKNQKGFFLAETIIMIALVTTVIAFVFPNVSKLYENFVNRAKYYDQTEDVFFLKAVGECLDNDTNFKQVVNNIAETDANEMVSPSGECIVKPVYAEEAQIYVAKYMATPVNDDYEFNKFLHRLKKTNNDTTAHRIIGRIKMKDGSYRYASVKYIFNDTTE